MRKAVPMIISAAAGLTIALSGCSSDSGPLNSDTFEDLVNNIVEEAVEGGTDADVDFDLGTGGGNADGPGLPTGFPSELPIPGGELFSALKINNYYSLSFEGSDPSEADALVDWFLSNGHEITNETEWDGTRGWLLSGTYEVNISHGYDADGLSILAYAVTVPE